MNRTNLLLDSVCKNPSIAVTLIECRANVHVRNKNGQTALDLLIAESSESPNATYVAKLLLGKGGETEPSASRSASKAKSHTVLLFTPVLRRS